MKGALDQESRNLGLPLCHSLAQEPQTTSCCLTKCQPRAQCQVWLSAGTMMHMNELEPQGAYHLNIILWNFQKNTSAD